MDEQAPVRLDKWLWAARFYKTRSTAAAAAASGRVKVNGGRAKAGLQLRMGDRVAIRKPPYEFMVVVKGLASRRGPSKVAVLLYEETAESLAARETMALALREQAASMPPMTPGRPSKRDRRLMARFKGK